jgi:Phage integrase, N-terminal SAM-like domain
MRRLRANNTAQYWVASQRYALEAAMPGYHFYGLNAEGRFAFGKHIEAPDLETAIRCASEKCRAHGAGPFSGLEVWQDARRVFTTESLLNVRRPEPVRKRQWQRSRRSARTSSKATAQQFLAGLLDEHRRLDRGGNPRRTYKEALERFTYDYLPTLKPRTQERYRSSLRQLNAAFGTLYLDEITRGRLADYASDRMKAGIKGATVRRDLAILSCLCSCAVSWGDIDTNPMEHFGKRHIRESPPRTTYPTARAG